MNSAQPATIYSKQKQHPTNCPTPVVDLMYRDESDKIAHKYIYWRRRPEEALLAEWIGEYYDKISDGYIPEGFAAAPRPFCARIYQRGNLLAEWIGRHRNESPAARAESPVTARPSSAGEAPPQQHPAPRKANCGTRQVDSGTTGQPSPETKLPQKCAVNDAHGDRRRRRRSGQSVA